MLEIEKGKLIERECPRHKAYAEYQALKFAHVGRRFLGCSLDNYRPVNDGQRAALQEIREYCEAFRDVEPSNEEEGVFDWADDEVKVRSRGLVLVGPVGTGKTHLAVAVLREAYRQGLNIYFADVPGVLANIRMAIQHGNQMAGREISECSKVDVLALDDFGAERTTDWVEEQLHLIINTRYASKLPTIITSNEPFSSLEKRIGKRIVSRLSGTSGGIVIDGPDYRLGGAA